MFRHCREDFIRKLLFNIYLIDDKYVHSNVCNKDGDTCQNFGRGLLEQNVHVMLPSKAFLFWTVLLECIIHLQNILQ